MSPDAAYNILKAMAELHGFDDRLHLWAQTAEDKQNADNNDAATSAKAKLEAFRFSFADVPIGAEICFKLDPSKTATVVSDRRVMYEDTEYSLSALACLLTEKDGPLQGPLYFTYEGEVLTDRRSQIINAAIKNS